MRNLDKLLSIASLSLSKHGADISGESLRLAGTLADQLLGMLSQCNGFYALESALHVFPTHSSEWDWSC